MRLFYQAFPKYDALRHELSWTHYRTLLRVDSETARTWYMNEAAAQNWSSRALERQIGTLYYERLLASQDRAAVEQEALQMTAASASPREFVRDPVLLEFLGVPGAGVLLESELEQALMGQLQAFLLELGKGFAFRYSVLHGHEQLFASKYKLILPSKDELRAELDRERAQLQLAQRHNGDS